MRKLSAKTRERLEGRRERIRALLENLKREPSKDMFRGEILFQKVTARQ
jgi:hypothetical protein